MADVTTLDEMYWPLMHIDPDTAKAIAESPCCVVCGRARPLNRHHIVFRSAGELYEGGRKLPKALVTLCGQGSNLYGASPDGTRVMYCHGRAHHKMLHFRNDRGRLEYIELDAPMDYLDALEEEGWEEVCVERLRRLAFACC